MAELRMKYLLNEHIGLRSWIFVPYAYYIKHERNARGLKRDEYELLALCDGAHDLPESPLLTSLTERGFCRPCAEGERLTDWQRPMACDNRYFPAMNWMITGKCNYNCLHCYNAVDNAPLMKEWTLEDALRLLDEAQICGINAFTLTGGEPMLHKNFFDIVEGIHRRGMYVAELNTNGHFITQGSLERFREIGCRPAMKISFDGLGHHDWLRDRAGAEQDALRAIRLCVENGFPVHAQTNLWRGNVSSLLPTAELLDQMGVEHIRVMRTSEAPRWLKNAGDATLPIEEYYEALLSFARAYTAKPRRMTADLWQFLRLYPETKSYAIVPVSCPAGQYRDTLPVCKGNRGMVAVHDDGGLYPCNRMAGSYEARGWPALGNVKTAGLQPLLRESEYLNEVCMTVKELSKRNEQCAKCRFFRWCAGGCRLIGSMLTGDKYGSDLAKCLFFGKGYYDRIRDALPDWRNLSPME